MNMRIFRISNIFSWSVAIFLASVLFWVSQKVQRAEDSLESVNAKISLELEAVRVLEAEWDYLNAPSRLEELANEYLSVQEPKAEQVVEDYSSIPEQEKIAVPEALPVQISIKKQDMPVASPKAAIIQETDRESFNSLLEGLSKEGGE